MFHYWFQLLRKHWLKVLWNYCETRNWHNLLECKLVRLLKSNIAGKLSLRRIDRSILSLWELSILIWNKKNQSEMQFLPGRHDLQSSSEVIAL